MKLKNIVVLLPVDSLEDLSLDQEPSEAQSFLSAWTVPFHPAIMVTAGKTAEWQHVDQFVQSGAIADALVLLPECSQRALPEGWIDRARASGALVLQDLADRDAAVAEVLAELDPLPGCLPFDELNADLVADLYALGFSQLQVELLTRQQRYLGSLDKADFERWTLRAAEAVMRGDGQSAGEEIQSAFDTLTEAREYFYSVQSHLLDLTLVAPSTTGRVLVDELANETPRAVLISGRTVATMAAEEPAALAALKTALAEERVDLLGGEFTEPALALMTPESILAEIRRGLAAYEEHLGERPTVFARRRFGLTPILPQILEHCGFAAACHFTLDGGRFPTSDQSRIVWEGAGDASLEALARLPIDASRAESFLRLPRQLGSVLDLDDVPTAVFAYWPGGSSCWYDALRRTNRYSPVLGKFSRLDTYFEETTGGGAVERYGPDEYRSPYLAEAVQTEQADPISRWVRYYARAATVDVIRTLRCMAQMIANASAAPVETDSLRRAVDELANNVSNPSRSKEEQLDGRLETLLREATEQVAHVLPRSTDAETSGRLCLNPSSFARAYEPGGKDADRAKADVPTSVEVPGMGFAWLDAETDRRKTQAETPQHKRAVGPGRRRRPAPPLAEENVLRNEFFEATIDPATGGIRAIGDYRTRGNRLAGQLALRLPELASGPHGSGGSEEDEAVYSRMVAQRIDVETAGPCEGRITSRGRLVDRDGNRLAGFVQTMRARRGSRVLELDVELTAERQPGPNPWQSYYAARFAWDDSAADLYRSVNLMSWPTDAERFEAPHFVEVRSGKRRTTILTGGLPYHRRFGLRKMDSLLIVRGETACRFRLGIGIDLAHPVSAAIDFLAPCPSCTERASRPQNDSGWLFHVDAPGVMATDWEPLVREGRLGGFRARLLETEGHAARLHLRSFRPPAVARQTDFLGSALDELEIDDDWIKVDLDAHQWVQVEVEWEENKD